MLERYVYGMCRVVLCISFLFVSGVSAAQMLNADKDGVALRGYDTVAYFTHQKALPGDKRLAYTWRGAEWRFVSTEDRQLFMDNPEQYAPQYGGFCAYSVSQKAKADANPKVWQIVDGKLYLNLNHQAAGLWKKDFERNRAEADKYWVHENP